MTADETCAFPFPLADGIHHAVVSDWEKIQTPDAGQIISCDQLPKTADPRALSKLAVLKFNGGLGTSMGAYIVTPYCMEANNQKCEQACPARRVPSKSRTE